MARLILICGPSGAGKTTYALDLAKEIGAVRFSIDPWMQTLFAKDMTALDYGWMVERVARCGEQIWETAAQVLALGGHVILDLGFTTQDQRKAFTQLAADVGVSAELHYLDAPVATRKQRVKNRNQQRDPAVYSFEVTDMMFNFMEPRFEVPTEDELRHGIKVSF